MTTPSRRIFTDVSWFEELDSTNTWLLQAAAVGRAEGAVAVADAQSAGRGRLSRRWESPSGSGLLASVLLRPRIPADELFAVSAVVTLAARDACAAIAGVSPGVKWPNDLVVDDAKLAGVLAETTGVGTDEVAVVVGVGINVSWPMPGGAADELGAVCLDTLNGRSNDRRALLDALLDSLEARRPSLDEAEARAEAVQEMARCTVTLGRRVRVELAQEQFLGEAVALDARGRLIVDTAGGRRVISVGDVVHLR